MKLLGIESSAAVTALAPITWGTTYIVTTELLPADHPLWSGLLRALPAGLAALILGRALPRGRWWWRALVLGTLNIGAFFPLLFLAAYRLPGGVAGIIGAVSPLVVMVMAVPLLSERLTARRISWGLLAVVGVAAMVLGPESGLDLLGVAAGLGGALSMALGTVLSKRWAPPVGPVAFTGWQLTAGGLVMLPLTVAVEGGPPPVDGAALLGYAWLAGVGGLLAYVLWFRGIGRMAAGAAGFLQVLSPLVAAGLGWLVLGERLTLLQCAGFVLALVSVVAAQWRPRRSGPGDGGGERLGDGDQVLGGELEVEAAAAPAHQYRGVLQC